MMSDLLSYSIMRSDKVPPVSLPPISPKGSLEPRNSAPAAVTLPPIAALLNYCYTNRFYQSRPATPALTEKNLNGLGLLSTVVMHGLLTLLALMLTPPLLTLLGSEMLSPATLPRLDRSTPALLLLAKLEALSTTLKSSSPPVVVLPPMQVQHMPLKRRQRLGPSCDLCRARKVKCDAEVAILAKNGAECGDYQLTQAQRDQLARGEAVALDAETNLVVLNQKLIRFKLCKLCHMKGLTCCFSKGFTKEDIMINSKKHDDAAAAPVVVVSLAKKARPAKIAKKKLLPSPVVAKTAIASLTLALSMSLAGELEYAGPAPTILLPSTRKSLCFTCRKRKVKCLFNSMLNKCESCYKKNVDCVFDCKPSK